jgi:hypothetical protein
MIQPQGYFSSVHNLALSSHFSCKTPMKPLLNFIPHGGGSNAEDE